ncbi:MAG: hypothetical protein CVU04_05865 [Bacteroidetes bacterium HGW-Bacteroidetes-20]|nr:MAG: hypothetical protein CVU04_05865 [Bacteroidetes bacterium HGW-Bacteroidetes-20]
MKKVLLTLSAVALLAVVFSSCKKECYCTTKDLQGNIIEQDELIPVISTSAECSAYETSANLGGFYEVKCDAR